MKKKKLTLTGLVCLITFFTIIFIEQKASATIYHIAPAAGWGGNGSPQAPFNSWDNLPDMKTGDDVYFKCGTIYSPSNYLNVNWEGTEANPAVIGAY